MTQWPPLNASLSSSGGNWETYLEIIYASYLADFHGATIHWNAEGKKISSKRIPEQEGKSATFWHVVSEGPDEASRTIDLARCERITWPRLMVDEFLGLYPAPANDRIVWWWNSRRNKSGVDERRLLIALADFSYVVVLADRGHYLLFWTAYPVDQPHRRKKMQKEHDAYWARIQ